MKYLISIRADEGDWSTRPVVDSAARLDASPPTHVSGELEYFAGLHPVWTATVVDAQGGRLLLHDRPLASTDGRLAAFWVVRAADLDVAIAWAAERSAAYAARLEIRPFIGSLTQGLGTPSPDQKA